MKAQFAWLVLFLSIAMLTSSIGCGCFDDDDDDDDSDSDDDAADDDAADDDASDDDYDCEDEDQIGECVQVVETTFDECGNDCWENAECYDSCQADCDADAYAGEAACYCDGSSWQETMLCLEICFRDLADCLDANDCTDPGECEEAWQPCWDDCNSR